MEEREEKEGRREEQRVREREEHGEWEGGT